MRTGSGTQQAQTRRMAGMRFLCYIRAIWQRTTSSACHLATHNFERLFGRDWRRGSCERASQPALPGACFPGRARPAASQFARASRDASSRPVRALAAAGHLARQGRQAAGAKAAPVSM